MFVCCDGLSEKKPSPERIPCSGKMPLEIGFAVWKCVFRELGNMRKLFESWINFTGNVLLSIEI